MDRAFASDMGCLADTIRWVANRSWRFAKEEQKKVRERNRAIRMAAKKDSSNNDLQDQESVASYAKEEGATCS